MDQGGRSERRRKRLRRLGVLLVTLGALGVVEVVLTMVWEEPFSSWAARGRQAEVNEELDKLLKAPVPPDEQRALAELEDRAARLEYRAGRFAKTMQRGKGIGRIEIPEIDVDLPFVRGTDTASLKRAPGHYSRTELPGQPGTTGIAGHRTTYGAPFRHIDKLSRGDEIEVTMPYGTFTYEVERLEEVTPDRVDVVRDVSYPRLVLIACTPLFSSARRIIVYARLRA